MALQRAKPGEVVDLTPFGARIGEARTQALVKSEGFEAVRLVLPAGTQISSHAVEGEITLHCLEGEVEVRSDTLSELGSGEWMFLPGGAEHSVQAIEDSSLLLTIILARHPEPSVPPAEASAGQSCPGR